MPVMRVVKRDDYTQMSNTHLRDQNLSLKAIGLLSKILSLPPNWDYTVAGLAAICKEGRDAVNAAIRELEASGYIVRERKRDDCGRLAGAEYTVYEQPHVPTADSPITDFPAQGFPAQGNPQQLNKDIINNLNNTPYSPPQGDGAGEDKPRDEERPARPRKRRAAKAEPEHEPEMFERFWAAYPRGEDRQAAIQEWDKLKPDRALMMTMSAALARDKDSKLWQRDIGIPYACRWLSHRRWEDEKKREADEPTPAREDEREWI